MNKYINKLKAIGIISVLLAIVFAAVPVNVSAEDTGELVTTGIYVGSIYYNKPVIDGNIIAFYQFESYQGSDLNGDGDTNDLVLVYYDIITGVLTSTGISTFYGDYENQPGICGNIITTYFYEYFYGSDLNGDGDTFDSVVVYYDISTGEMYSTKCATVSSADVDISDDIIAFSIYEYGQGIDYNEDGDKYDSFLAYYDISSGSLTITGNIVYYFSNIEIDGDIIVYGSFEAMDGIDRNNDGDLSDSYLMYYDISPGNSEDTVTNTWIYMTYSLYEVSFSGNIIALDFSEYINNVDLNGDGDIYDKVLAYYDITTGELTSTGILGYYGMLPKQPSIDDKLIALYVYEYYIGEDLNGDGDIGDFFMAYYDITTDTLTATDISNHPSKLGISGNLIAFNAQENYIGEDLNGDGDLNDAVLVYYKISFSPIEDLMYSVSAMRLSDGVEASFMAKLEAAQTSIENDRPSALYQLNAFKKEVEAQRGLSLSDAGADLLITYAQEIIDSF